jgi:hypothetical protein
VTLFTERIGTTQWRSFGNIIDPAPATEPRSITFDLDSAAGHSGGPIWLNWGGSFARRIRFSATKYSFCSNGSWFTEPVTDASNRAHFLSSLRLPMLLWARIIWSPYPASR